MYRFFLWVVDSIAAIQLVIIVTLIMSIAILPAVKGQMVPKLLIVFGIGCVIGSPIGITFFNYLDLDWIKFLAALVILVVTVWNAYLYFMPMILKRDLFKDPGEGTPSAQMGVGIASGILGSTLAMPAPLVMLYLSGTSYEKQAIRSTILVFFHLGLRTRPGLSDADSGCRRSNLEDGSHTRSGCINRGIYRS